MTLEEAVRIIEKTIPSFDGLRMVISQTGEEYITIVSGGIPAEGEIMPCFCTTEEHAVRLWYDAVMDYARKRTGRLYWRKRPEMIEDVIYLTDRGFRELGTGKCALVPTTVYKIYSRLLISDLPPKWLTQDEYDRCAGP